MIFKAIKKIALVIFFSFISFSVIAQDEFRIEMGPVFGSSLYMGDAKIAYPKNAEITYGWLFRYRFNERLALRTEWNMTKVSGTYSKKFRNDVNTLDVCGEFNFFDYVHHSYKLTGRRYSPYIFLGAGIMVYPYESSSFEINPSASFGAGFKIKATKRLNVNLQYSERLLFADNMEGIGELNNANKLNGTNFLNNDFLSSFTVSITFDLWRKSKDCKCF
jgi:hypothetical protein